MIRRLVNGLKTGTKIIQHGGAKRRKCSRALEDNVKSVHPSV